MLPVGNYKSYYTRSLREHIQKIGDIHLEIRLYTKKKKKAFMKFPFDSRSAVMNDTVKLRERTIETQLHDLNVC